MAVNEPWNARDEAYFIDLVRQYPPLWNPDDENYKKKHLKTELYSRLVKDWKKRCPEKKLTTDIAKQKFCRLRNYFFQELHKRNMNGEFSLRKWIHFDKMLFLIKEMSPDELLEKCLNLLSTLIRIAGSRTTKTGSIVIKLIQHLIDGAIAPEEFATQLQKELHFNNKPYLVNVLKRSLAYVQQALINGVVRIEGILPPPVILHSLVNQFKIFRPTSQGIIHRTGGNSSFASQPLNSNTVFTQRIVSNEMQHDGIIPETNNSNINEGTGSFLSSQLPNENSVPPLRAWSGSERGNTCSSMSPDEIKSKCQKWLSTLIRITGSGTTQTGSTVINLIQHLIDGAIAPEEFATQLQKEFHFNNHPYLPIFLKKSLAYVQEALISGEMTIEGIFPPPVFRQSPVPQPSVQTSENSEAPVRQQRPNTSSPVCTSSNTGHPMVASTSNEEPHAFNVALGNLVAASFNQMPAEKANAATEHIFNVLLKFGSESNYRK